MLTVDYDILDVRPGHRLLDLGCGRGRHTHEATARGARPVSADLDEAVLKDVRDGAAAVGLPASPCLAADATRLPFGNDSFDRVIVSEVMEHIPDDRAAMAEVARVLKPGGRVAVTVPRFWPEQVCWALSDDYHAQAGGHVRIYTKTEMKDKLAGAGLRAVAHSHAHALHAPYWWIRCWAEGSRAERAYHRFLVRMITGRVRWAAALERALDPLLGKSLVVYAEKAA